MGVALGDRLGPYEIIAELGAGGMGRVYRARDTRLGRFVAIKVLFSKVADDDGRRRFLQEGKTTSSLNHPHILTVHEVAEFEGQQYLVSEFVDGGTLRDWGRAEKRSWRQVLEILLGVGDALSCAHAVGILHRDIKPENILVAKNGYAKLADFGLAKLLQSTGSESATRTSISVTRPGQIVGTLAYMSPEQVSGRAIDARSDIFSFAVVLYEMLARRRPFPGDTELEVLHTIGQGAPVPLSDDLPLALRMIVDKALEKDPAERYQSIREMLVDMRRLLRQREPPRGPAVTAAIGRQQPRRFWILAGVVLLAIGVISGRTWLRPAPTVRSVQVQRLTDFVGVEESPAISPDGKTVAFVARVDGRKQIWVRLLAGGAPLQLTRDDADHEYPRWTPDSSSLIYFLANPSAGEPGTIWEISALGGTGRRIASALSAGDVSHDGRRIATFQMSGQDVALVAISRDGVLLRELRRFARVSGYDIPRWSPDDRWIAFARGGTYLFDFAINIIAVEGGEPREVTHAEMLRGLCWLPDSSGLVYSSSSGSTILYPPIFNLRVVRRTGSGDRQLTFGEVSYVEPDVVVPGRLAASRVRIQSDVWRFPVFGSPQQNTNGAIRITHQTGQPQTPSLSPDGKEFVYLSDSGGHGNLWVSTTDGSKTRQITFERDPAVVIGVPIWSPSGDRIVFILTRQGKTGEWVVNPDGSNLRQLVPLGSGATWSPDGQWLYYQREHCIEKIPIDGGLAVQVRCEDSPAPESFSADGSTLYYVNGYRAPGAGGLEIRKARPENGPSASLSRIPGSRLPFDGFVWQQVLSPDGNWLAAPFLDRGTTNLWAMPVDGGPMRQLTDFGQRPILIVRRVSWSPDGKYIYAAVADTDADVVLLDGLLP